MFDRVVCVNLERRPERWLRFCQGLPADWPFRPVERLDAIDGTRVQPPKWYRPACAGNISRRRRQPYEVALRGAWGCLRSHVRIWEEALSNRLQSVLIFEDDALFCEGFAERARSFVAAVPDDWDQIYLGGQHLRTTKEPPVLVAPGVLRGRNVNRTHAYAIRGEMMLTAYHEMCRVPDSPREEDCHLDHRFGRMHQTGDWNIYCPEQWLVGQSGGHSDVVGPGKPVSANFWNKFPVAQEGVLTHR